MATPNHSELDVELGDLLQEFNDVVKELSTSHVNEHMFVKRPTALNDAEDSDYSSETSLGNSLNASEEELNITGMTKAPKGMPTDTSDLQSFIEKLDRELAEM
ncbi:regulator of cell cycle RGCC-like isoform X2 [Triplophysa rosa]|uniref:regulator of cell cycle RGCC-like isoform X2 n=1 Tax=Triplophysa rosa TaxID=992332 RepID=UPI002545DF16|nr:regulator of cell cycle RGCC-like isoform X2 [Triplophysa rosa]